MIYGRPASGAELPRDRSRRPEKLRGSPRRLNLTGLMRRRDHDLPSRCRRGPERFCRSRPCRRTAPYRSTCSTKRPSFACQLIWLRTTVGVGQAYSKDSRIRSPGWAWIPCAAGASSDTHAPRSPSRPGTPQWRAGSAKSGSTTSSFRGARSRFIRRAAIGPTENARSDAACTARPCSVSGVVGTITDSTSSATRRCTNSAGRQPERGRARRVPAVAEGARRREREQRTVLDERDGPVAARRCPAERAPRAARLRLFDVGIAAAVRKRSRWGSCPRDARRPSGRLTPTATRTIVTALASRAERSPSSP